MAIKEHKPAVVKIPAASSPPESATTLDPMLLLELEDLEPQEQQVLSELLKRAKQDRSVNGPMDELAVVVNGLKEYPTEDDWMFLLKLNEKIAPDLHKEFINAKNIPLTKEFPSITKSISEVINNRASNRDFQRSVLSYKTLSALLDYSCGVRGTLSAYNRRDIPLRNFPTAGGLQCTELYLAVNEVEDIPQGLYHYNPMQSSLEQIEKGNFRWRVVNCCPTHEWMAEAGVVIFIAPDLSRLTWKYGSQTSYRLAHLETGVVCQNLHLVATALELGSCLVFGFNDAQTDALLGLDGRREFTTLLFAVGNKLDREVLLQKVTDNKLRT